VSSKLNALVAALEAIDNTELELSVTEAERNLRNAVARFTADQNKISEEPRQVPITASLAVVDRYISKNIAAADPRDWMFFAAREVAHFLDYAQNGTHSDIAAKYADLLPVGHPDSTNSALSFMSDPAVLRASAAWFAADDRIAPEARDAVFNAFASTPGTTDHQFAIARLRSLPSGLVPSEFVIKPIVAAFGVGNPFAGGNSSAARSARARAQRRDSKGRFAEMGGGARFSGLFDGFGQSITGKIAGVPQGSNDIEIEVLNHPRLPNGIYPINANGVEGIKAVLRNKGATGKSIPVTDRRALATAVPEADLLATRKDAPTGWNKNPDGSYTSDDGYSVSMAEGMQTDSRFKGGGVNGAYDSSLPVYKLADENGETVAFTQGWADIQKAAANNDESTGKSPVKARLRAAQNQPRDSKNRFTEPKGFAQDAGDSYAGMTPEEAGRLWADRQIEATGGDALATDDNPYDIDAEYGKLDAAELNDEYGSYYRDGDLVSDNSATLERYSPEESAAFTKAVTDRLKEQSDALSKFIADRLTEGDPRTESQENRLSELNRVEKEDAISDFLADNAKALKQQGGFAQKSADLDKIYSDLEDKYISEVIDEYGSSSAFKNSIQAEEDVSSLRIDLEDLRKLEEAGDIPGIRALKAEYKEAYDQAAAKFRTGQAFDDAIKRLQSRPGKKIEGSEWKPDHFSYEGPNGGVIEVEPTEDGKWLASHQYNYMDRFGDDFPYDEGEKIFDSKEEALKYANEKADYYDGNEAYGDAEENADEMKGGYTLDGYDQAAGDDRPFVNPSEFTDLSRWSVDKNGDLVFGTPGGKTKVDIQVGSDDVSDEGVPNRVTSAEFIKDGKYIGSATLSGEFEDNLRNYLDIKKQQRSYPQSDEDRARLSQESIEAYAELMSDLDEISGAFTNNRLVKNVEDDADFQYMIDPEKNDNYGEIEGSPTGTGDDMVWTLGYDDEVTIARQRDKNGKAQYFVQRTAEVYPATRYEPADYDVVYEGAFDNIQDALEDGKSRTGDQGEYGADEYYDQWGFDQAAGGDALPEWEPDAKAFNDAVNELEKFDLSPGKDGDPATRTFTSSDGRVKVSVTESSFWDDGDEDKLASIRDYIDYSVEVDGQNVPTTNRASVIKAIAQGLDPNRAEKEQTISDMKKKRFDEMQEASARFAAEKEERVKKLDTHNLLSGDDNPAINDLFDSIENYGSSIEGDGYNASSYFDYDSGQAIWALEFDDGTVFEGRLPINSETGVDMSRGDMSDEIYSEIKSALYNIDDQKQRENRSESGFAQAAGDNLDKIYSDLESKYISDLIDEYGSSSAYKNSIQAQEDSSSMQIDLEDLRKLEEAGDVREISAKRDELEAAYAQAQVEFRTKQAFDDAIKRLETKEANRVLSGPLGKQVDDAFERAVENLEPGSKSDWLNKADRIREEAADPDVVKDAIRDAYKGDYAAALDLLNYPGTEEIYGSAIRGAFADITSKGLGGRGFYQKPARNEAVENAIESGDLDAISNAMDDPANAADYGRLQDAYYDREGEYLAEQFEGGFGQAAPGGSMDDPATDAQYNFVKSVLDQQGSNLPADLRDAMEEAGNNRNLTKGEIGTIIGEMNKHIDKTRPSDKQLASIRRNVIAKGLDKKEADKIIKDLAKLKKDDASKILDRLKGMEDTGDFRDASPSIIGNPGTNDYGVHYTPRSDGKWDATAISTANGAQLDETRIVDSPAEDLKNYDGVAVADFPGQDDGEPAGFAQKSGAKPYDWRSGNSDEERIKAAKSAIEDALSVGDEYALDDIYVDGGGGEGRASREIKYLVNEALEEMEIARSEGEYGDGEDEEGFDQAASGKMNEPATDLQYDYVKNILDEQGSRLPADLRDAMQKATSDRNLTKGEIGEIIGRMTPLIDKTIPSSKQLASIRRNVIAKGLSTREANKIIKDLPTMKKADASKLLDRLKGMKDTGDFVDASPNLVAKGDGFDVLYTPRSDGKWDAVPMNPYDGSDLADPEIVDDPKADFDRNYANASIKDFPGADDGEPAFFAQSAGDEDSAVDDAFERALERLEPAGTQDEERLRESLSEEIGNPDVIKDALKDARNGDTTQAKDLLSYEPTRRAYGPLLEKAIQRVDLDKIYSDLEDKYISEVIDEYGSSSAFKNSIQAEEDVSSLRIDLEDLRKLEEAGDIPGIRALKAEYKEAYDQAAAKFRTGQAFDDAIKRLQSRPGKKIEGSEWKPDHFSYEGPNGGVIEVFPTEDGKFEVGHQLNTMDRSDRELAFDEGGKTFDSKEEALKFANEKADYYDSMQALFDAEDYIMNDDRGFGQEAGESLDSIKKLVDGPKNKAARDKLEAIRNSAPSEAGFDQRASDRENVALQTNGTIARADAEGTDSVFDWASEWTDFSVNQGRNLLSDWWKYTEEFAQWKTENDPYAADAGYVDVQALYEALKRPRAWTDNGDGSFSYSGQHLREGGGPTIEIKPRANEDGTFNYDIVNGRTGDTIDTIEDVPSATNADELLSPVGRGDTFFTDLSQLGNEVSGRDSNYDNLFRGYGFNQSAGFDQKSASMPEYLEEDFAKIELTDRVMKGLNNPKYPDYDRTEYNGSDGSKGFIDYVNGKASALLKDSKNNTVASRDFKQEDGLKAEDWLKRRIAEHNREQNKEATGGFSAKQMEPATPAQYDMLQEQFDEREFDANTAQAIEEAIANKNLTKAQMSTLIGQGNDAPFKPGIDPTKPSDRQIKSLTNKLMTKDIDAAERDQLLSDLPGMKRDEVEALNNRLRSKKDIPGTAGFAQEAGDSGGSRIADNYADKLNELKAQQSEAASADNPGTIPDMMAKVLRDIEAAQYDESLSDAENKFRLAQIIRDRLDGENPSWMQNDVETAGRRWYAFTGNLKNFADELDSEAGLTDAQKRQMRRNVRNTPETANLAAAVEDAVKKIDEYKARTGEDGSRFYDSGKEMQDRFNEYLEDDSPSFILDLMDTTWDERNSATDPELSQMYEDLYNSLERSGLERFGSVQMARYAAELDSGYLSESEIDETRDFAFSTDVDRIAESLEENNSYGDIRSAGASGNLYNESEDGETISADVIDVNGRRDTQEFTSNEDGSAREQAITWLANEIADANNYAKGGDVLRSPGKDYIDLDAEAQEAKDNPTAFADRLDEIAEVMRGEDSGSDAATSLEAWAKNIRDFEEKGFGQEAGTEAKPLSPKMGEPATDAQYDYLKELLGNREGVSPDLEQAIKDALESKNLTKAQMGAFLGQMRVLGTKAGFDPNKPTKRQLQRAKDLAAALNLSPKERRELGLTRLSSMTPDEIGKLIDKLKRRGERGDSGEGSGGVRPKAPTRPSGGPEGGASLELDSGQPPGKLLPNDYRTVFRSKQETEFLVYWDRANTALESAAAKDPKFKTTLDKFKKTYPNLVHSMVDAATNPEASQADIDKVVSDGINLKEAFENSDYDVFSGDLSVLNRLLNFRLKERTPEKNAELVRPGKPPHSSGTGVDAEYSKKYNPNLANDSKIAYVRTGALNGMEGNEIRSDEVVSIIEKDLRDGVGFKEAIIAVYDPKTGKSAITEGNHRVAAAKKAGVGFVPIRVVNLSSTPGSEGWLERTGKQVSDSNLPSPDGNERGWPAEINPRDVFGEESLLPEAGFAQGTPKERSVTPQSISRILANAGVTKSESRKSGLKRQGYRASEGFQVQTDSEGNVTVNYRQRMGSDIPFSRFNETTRLPALEKIKNALEEKGFVLTEREEGGFKVTRIGDSFDQSVLDIPRVSETVDSPKEAEKIASDAIDSNKKSEADLLKRIKNIIRAGAGSWVPNFDVRRGETRDDDVVTSNSAPINPVSGHSYSASNFFELAAAGNERGYTDRRWMTYLQAEKAGAKIRGGEQGVKILVPVEREVKYRDPKTGETKTSASIENREQYVFNAEQMDGLGPDTAPRSTGLTSGESIDHMLARWGQAELIRNGRGIPRINIGGGAGPRWIPAASGQNDSIRLPDRSMFESPEALVNSLTHEIVHGAGFQDRLDRYSNKKGLQGDKRQIALEELTAELGSAILMQRMGIPFDTKKHAAYVDSHIRAENLSEEDLNFAFAEGQIAADYILGNDVLPRWDNFTTDFAAVPTGYRPKAPRSWNPDSELSSTEAPSAYPPGSPGSDENPIASFAQAAAKKFEGKATKDSQSALEKVTEQLLEKIKTGAVPWRKPFKGIAGANIQRNPASKHIYTGINQHVLSIMQMVRGYSDPRWMTYKQAETMGGQVRKGEKAAYILVPMRVNTEDAKTGEESSFVMFKAAAVFNVEQIDGLELPTIESEGSKLNDLTPLESHEFLVERYEKAMTARTGSPVKIMYRDMSDLDSPHWSPSLDRIVLPNKSQFNSPEELFDTLTHEMVHSTGHADRLDRTELGKDYGKADGVARAKEELIAEIGSALLADMFGVDSSFDNTAAYVQSWLQRLKSHPEEVIQASKEAQKAVDYILGTDLGDWSPLEGYGPGLGVVPKKEEEDNG
jgi:antirestriction protein ArdC